MNKQCYQKDSEADKQVAQEQALRPYDVQPPPQAPDLLEDTALPLTGLQESTAAVPSLYAWEGAHTCRKHLPKHMHGNNSSRPPTQNNKAHRSNVPNLQSSQNNNKNISLPSRNSLLLALCHTLRHNVL